MFEVLMVVTMNLTTLGWQGSASLHETLVKFYQYVPCYIYEDCCPDSFEVMNSFHIRTSHC